MSKVVSLSAWKREQEKVVTSSEADQEAVEDIKVAAKDYFEELAKRNQEAKDRAEEERKEKNRKVLRSYRIK